MKSIQKKLKQDSYESIFFSCIAILLGLIMIIFSKNISNIISYLIGGLLIVNGLLKIFYYFRYEGKYNIFNYDLSFGILNVIIGVVCIIFTSELQNIFRIVIGLIVIYEAIINISLASKILFVDKVSGIISLLISILMIVCGGSIIFTKGLLITTIGIILIIFAIMNIIENIIFNHNLNKIEEYLNNRYM